MSDSFIDRHGLELTGGSDGPLTRSFGDLSTSGMIREDAAHWAIEPFIPIEPGELVQYLLSRNELSGPASERFHDVVDLASQELQVWCSSSQFDFSLRYGPLDPDSDCRHPCSKIPVAPESSDTTSEQEVEVENESKRIAIAEDSAKTIDLCSELLQAAGYRQLTQEEIEECVGVASQWGVPLHVDFNLFAHLVVFARGDIIGTRLRRRWRKLYRREIVDVPIYQRMVVIFQTQRDLSGGEDLVASSLHLRMFKNIPKQDIDMLLPGSRVRISGVDRVKIVIPSLGGFLMSARKAAQYALLFAALALHWTAILVVLVIGYLVKSVLSYFQTKNRYQLHLNRNLYFQKLDTNAGVGYRLIQQAHRQAMCETALVYYAIAINREPISTRRLRRRCERFVREAIDVETCIRVEIALERLQTMGVIYCENDNWDILGIKQENTT